MKADAAWSCWIGSSFSRAGRTWRCRLGYTAIAFGVWDIFYYLFLKVMCGWPHSVMDWDVLFLIPLPWWGPVLAPVLIALLLILWGTLATQFENARTPVRSQWAAAAIAAVGAVLGLQVFMADTLAAAHQGMSLDAILNVLPKSFNWPLFCAALLLMAAPVIHLLWSFRSNEQAKLARFTVDNRF